MFNGVPPFDERRPRTAFLGHERPWCRADAVPVEENRASASEKCECFTLASVLCVQRPSTEITVQLHRWRGPDPPERL